MSSDANPLNLTGTVIKKSQGTYFVRAGDRTLPCAATSRLRKVLVYPTAAPTSRRHRVQAVQAIDQVDPVAVGDQVRFQEAGNETGYITEVLPRRNTLSRRAAMDHGAGGRTTRQGMREQVIVANVDQIVAVLSVAQPAPKWELLDRYLVAAELGNIPTLICLTKADLLTEPEAAEEVLAEVWNYRRLGYSLAVVSAETGAGLPDLRAMLAGRVSVFVGKSGVGKTTLLNALEPGLGLRVQQVNTVTGKGKHTTTHLEMFDLASGGQVVDTPGMREFGLEKFDADLAHGFVELRPYLGACKFGLDCTHTHEPGCAVKAAVDAGRVSPRRYQSYLRVQEG